ncbi:MAG: superoxide dismutase [Hyphomonadaceae bacterium]|nr:superoxide dismutase [Hyphomonadaceae bacterium]
MFKLIDLPFDANALEPHMSRDTLNTHHGKHHAAYINKMNAFLAERESPPTSLEEVVRLAKRENDKKLFNNAAQAWNHGFFWMSLTPRAHGEPQGELRAAIDKAFGDVGNFRKEAKAKGEGHFASGWVWLVADASGAVQLIDTHDADTVITDDKVTPLSVCDVWEHAYYLDYKNERGRFLEAYLNTLINWRFAEAQYAAARKGERGWTYPT